MFQAQEVVIADEKVVLDIQEESSEPSSNGEENSFGPCLRDINTCGNAVGAVTGIGDIGLRRLLRSRIVGERSRLVNGWVAHTTDWYVTPGTRSTSQNPLPVGHSS